MHFTHFSRSNYIFVFSIIFAIIGVLSISSLALQLPASPTLAYTGPALFYANGPGDVVGFRCKELPCTDSKPIPALYSFTSLTNSISAALPADNLPIVSYRVDQGNPIESLYVSKCRNPECTAADTSVVTTHYALDASERTKIAIPSDGLPVILLSQSNSSSINHSLVLVKCQDIRCSLSNVITTIVPFTSPDFAGDEYDMTIGSDNFPVVVYRSGLSPVSITVLKCHDPYCGASHTVTFSGIGASANQPSISVSGDGNPIIAFTTSNFQLNIIKCFTLDCSTHAITQHLPGVQARELSLHVTSDDLPILFYRNFSAGIPSSLQTLKCQSSDCASGIDVINTIEAATSTAGVGRSSAALSSGGLPIASYSIGQSTPSQYAIKVARCLDLTCNSVDYSILYSGPINIISGNTSIDG